MESPIYSGKPMEHKYNTRSKVSKKVINYKELEGDSGDDMDSEEELDPVNFQEFLALKFPSKYMRSKLAATKAICKNKNKPSGVRLRRPIGRCIVVVCLICFSWKRRCVSYSSSEKSSNFTSFLASSA